LQGALVAIKVTVAIST